MSGEKRIIKAVIGNIPELIAGTAGLAAILITFANVIARYGVSRAIGGAEECVSACLCYMIFVGAAVAYKEKMHYGIDVVVALMPGKMRMAVKIFTQLTLCATSFYLAYLSYQLADRAWIKLTAYLRIPYFYIDFSMTLGFGFICYYSFKGMVVDSLRHLRKTAIRV